MIVIMKKPPVRIPPDEMCIRDRHCIQCVLEIQHRLRHAQSDADWLLTVSYTHLVVASGFVTDRAVVTEVSEPEHIVDIF